MRPLRARYPDISKAFTSRRCFQYHRHPSACSVTCTTNHTSQLHTRLPASHRQDHRSRLSDLWAPSGGIAVSANEDAHSKLLRAGFLRQAHSGIFHMLPLGLRIQEKVERLIDRHMSRLGASKLDLSSISSRDLWRRSGRLTKVNSELLQFQDRKGTEYLLSPTHEEEITCLVAEAVKSYKELPIRLYQISRKYRDELRPRHGLLRSREFVMKDLYTFDYNETLALETYDLVREAYTAIFNELKIPYLVAEADSGDIGGDLSHEYHFPTPQGEDHIISCRDCNYAVNEELAEASTDVQSVFGELKWIFMEPDAISSTSILDNTPTYSVWRGITRDKTKLINVWYPVTPSNTTDTAKQSNLPEVNTHIVKSIEPTLDSGVGNAAAVWASHLQNSIVSGSDTSKPTIRPTIVNLIDYRLPLPVQDAITSEDSSLPINPVKLTNRGVKLLSSVISKNPYTKKSLNLLRIKDGDACSRCGEGRLQVQKAIELGHTFFLGTRYSEPLNAVIALPNVMLDNGTGIRDCLPMKGGSDTSKVPMQMGCHGIGVSRMIGAVAETLADGTGLNWPRVLAPYEAIIIPVPECELDVMEVYDVLVAEPPETPGGSDDVDVVLDDRHHPFAWKMRDADLVGYPVIVILGKRWKRDRVCEVQCRRLSIREEVPIDRLSSFVKDLLSQL